MRSSDWQPMETAPLNPYGQAYGPVVLIWDQADNHPWPAQFEPMHGWKERDTGPAWVVCDGIGDSAIAPENAAAWMPIAAPWSESAMAHQASLTNAPHPAAALAARIAQDGDAMRVAANAAFSKLHEGRGATEWVSTTAVRAALLAALEAIAMEDAEK